MQFYLEKADSVLEKVGSKDSGLSSAEAAKRLQTNGKNVLAKEKHDSLIKKFFKQFADPMTLVLLVAAAISIGVSAYAGEPFTDTFIILFVVVYGEALTTRGSKRLGDFLNRHRFSS